MNKMHIYCHQYSLKDMKSCVVKGFVLLCGLYSYPSISSANEILHVAKVKIQGKHCIFFPPYAAKIIPNKV